MTAGTVTTSLSVCLSLSLASRITHHASRITRHADQPSSADHADHPIPSNLATVPSRRHPVLLPPITIIITTIIIITSHYITTHPPPPPLDLANGLSATAPSDVKGSDCPLI